MKKIIDLQITSQKTTAAQCRCDLLAVGLFCDVKKLDKTTAELNDKLKGSIERIGKLGDFKAKLGDSILLYTDGCISAQRLLLVGLGEKKKATTDTLRKAAAAAARKALETKAKSVALALHSPFAGRFDLSTMAQVISEGAYFGSFRYDEYVTLNGNGRPDSLDVALIDPDRSKVNSLKKGIARGVIIAKAQAFARTLANRPANVINPPVLADEAEKLAKDTPGLICTVLDEKQIAEKGMGGLMAVGAGSKTPPRFIVLKYAPAARKAKGSPTVALVGKAITFDSGGISIKPAQDMDHMKLDKSGGIAVMAAIKAAAELKLPLNLYAIIPSAENMPGPSSYRPGDIITTFSKKTVEVQNTDAEGRLILCDALHYAVKQNCDIIIDIATLTGACMVALGKYKAGLMGNDRSLMRQLRRAAQASGEKVWPMPSGDEYAEEMKSKIADLKNIGSKWGGACTAGAFLRQFVADKKWAHIDMAGVDMIEKSTSFAAEGASGFGVRLFVYYLMNLAE